MVINLVNKYLDLIQPDNIVELFDTEEEFISWLELGTKKDLECTLKEFEKYNMFEHCIIIKKVKDAKNN